MKYRAKPETVDAVQVTRANFDEMVTICGAPDEFETKGNVTDVHPVTGDRGPWTTVHYREAGVTASEGEWLVRNGELSVWADADFKAHFVKARKSPAKPEPVTSPHAEAAADAAE